MKKMLLLGGVLLALGIVGLFSVYQPAVAEEELVRTSWPSAEDPGMPFYARVELHPPHIFNDGEWAAIVFYRDPNCVPADFNLISFFDIPAAFACPHTVEGDSLWHDAPYNGAPKVVTITGSGEVPVWFVPWEAVEEYARADGTLTVTDLLEVDGRLVGYADQYTETLQPHAEPAIGGGGHPNPKMIIDARGHLEDGRDFKLHISWINDVVKAIEIQFR